MDFGFKTDDGAIFSSRDYRPTSLIRFPKCNIRPSPALFKGSACKCSSRMRSCSNNVRKPLLKSIAAIHCETRLAITVKFARSVFAALPLCRFTARSELRKVLFLVL